MVMKISRHINQFPAGKLRNKVVVNKSRFTVSYYKSKVIFLFVTTDLKYGTSKCIHVFFDHCLLELVNSSLHHNLAFIISIILFWPIIFKCVGFFLLPLYTSSSTKDLVRRLKMINFVASQKCPSFLIMYRNYEYVMYRCLSQTIVHKSTEYEIWGLKLLEIPCYTKVLTDRQTDTQWLLRFLHLRCSKNDRIQVLNNP